MFLLEPPPTAYDLRFTLFGFPIRITPWFWLATLLLGGSYSDGARLIIWVLVVLVSILIHELGHAFAFRYFGMASHIVLYHFGGIAVAGNSGLPWQTYRADRDPRQQIVISLAGPLVQLVAATMVIVPLTAMMASRGMPVTSIRQFFTGVMRIVGDNEQALELVFQFLYVNVGWSLLNLLPVYPLDGGQISRNLFLLYGGAQAAQHSLMLSVFTAGALAVFGFSRGDSFLGIMFAMLAWSSYQSLEQYRGRGPWG